MNEIKDRLIGQAIRDTARAKAYRHTGTTPSAKRVERLLGLAKSGATPRYLNKPRTTRLLWMAASFLLILPVTWVIWQHLHLDKPVLPRKTAAPVFITPVPLMSPTDHVQANTLEEKNDTIFLTRNDHHPLAFRIRDDKLNLDRLGQVRVVEQTEQMTHLALERGRVACSVSKKAPDERFVIDAGNITVRVIGTTFSVALVDDETVEVVVASGVVLVQEGSEREWRVSKGEYLRIGSGGERVRPTLADQSAVSSLERLFDASVPVDRNGEELTAVTAPDREKIAPASTPSKPTKHEITRLKEILAKGDASSAEIAIKRYLEKSPHDGAAWSLLADCKRIEKAWHDAIAAYKHAALLGNDFESSRAQFLMGVVYQEELDNDDAAIQAFEAFLHKSDTNGRLTAAAMVRLARSKIRKDEIGAATRLLNEVMERFDGSQAASRAKQLLKGIGR